MNKKLPAPNKAVKEEILLTPLASSNNSQMKEVIKADQKWYFVIIEDNKALPGKSLIELLNHLLNIIKFPFVIVDKVYGAGINNLVQYEDEIIKIDELLKILPEVGQFDWGDFFLFLKYPETWKNPPKESYPYVVSQTDTTVRAVDDTYMYVYTPFEEIVSALKENYIIENIQIDLIQNLEFPE